MPKRRRPIRLEVYVSEEEKMVIDENVEKSRAGNFSNYARQQLIRGSVTQIDLLPVHELIRQISLINRSMNQIVHRANILQDLHEEDYRDMQIEYNKTADALLRTIQRLARKSVKAVEQPSKNLPPMKERLQ